MTLSKYWKCSGCGTINYKKNDTAADLLSLGNVNISGGETCADCYTRHEVSGIYQGKHDPQEDEITIDKMVNDPSNAVWNPTSKMWSYNG